jgi:glucosamine-6-phosphate deaminase
MDMKIDKTKQELGVSAAAMTAKRIREALERKSEISIILATGASQFEMLSELIQAPGIDWSKVTVFHLDEYIGLPDSHPASFRKYLKERFADQVPSLKEFVYVNGDAADPQAECERLGERIGQTEIEVACIGIGENAHIAFNDPPADFETNDAYIVVDLDDACRRQQLGEGWFPTFEDVPKQAISMGVRQIMKSKCLIVSVPDERKAAAVKAMLTAEISPNVPSTILREHADCHLFLDEPAASQLS